MFTPQFVPEGRPDSAKTTFSAISLNVISFVTACAGTPTAPLWGVARNVDGLLVTANFHAPPTTVKAIDEPLLVAFCPLGPPCGNAETIEIPQTDPGESPVSLKKSDSRWAKRT